MKSVDVLLNREGSGQQGGCVGLACAKGTNHQQEGGEGGSRKDRGDLFGSQGLTMQAGQVHMCEHQ